MFTTIISSIIDGIVSAGIKWLQGIQQRREDRQAGREDQRRADDEATIKEATNAAAIKDEVQGASPAELDAYLNSLRHDSPSGDH